jgi:transcriptional regulator with XRE-family HTH domain
MTKPQTNPVPVEQALGLLRALPGTVVEHVGPAGAGTAHHIDVRWEGGAAEIRWSEDRAFELSSPHDDDVFGAGHDERLSSPADVAVRVQALLRGDSTAQVIGVWLGDVRRAAGITQRELAERPGCSQPAIAQQERRDDIHVSVLRRTCAALGVGLNVSATVCGSEQVWLRTAESVAKRKLDRLEMIDPSTGEVVGELPTLHTSGVTAKFNRSLGAARTVPAAGRRRCDAKPELLEAT